MQNAEKQIVPKKLGSLTGGFNLRCNLTFIPHSSEERLLICQSCLNFVKPLKGVVEAVVYRVNCSVPGLIKIKFTSINFLFTRIISGL